MVVECDSDTTERCNNKVRKEEKWVTDFALKCLETVTRKFGIFISLFWETFLPALCDGAISDDNIALSFTADIFLTKFSFLVQKSTLR